MRKIFALLFLMTAGYATIAPPPGHFALEAELLYLRPNIDQSYYVISSILNTQGGEFYPNGKRYNLDPSYHPGFRLDLGYGFCNGVSCMDLLFTYFNGTDSDSTSGPFLFDVIGFPGDGTQIPEDTSYEGTARLKHKYQYYAGDLIYSRLMFNCCPEGLSFLLGLHGAYIKVNEKFNSSGFFINDDNPELFFNDLERFSRYWGIGPEFGVDFSYIFPPFCQCPAGLFSIEATARGGLLCTNTIADITDFTSRTAPAESHLSNKPIWRVNPFVDTRIGLNYDCCLCCLKTQFSLGYEFIWYSKAVDQVISYDVAFAGDTVDFYNDFSLHGPYFSVACAF